MLIKTRSLRGLLFSIIFIAGIFCFLPQHVFADVPLAARLLAEPYQSTGIRVNISNLGSSMRGLTTDGTTVYAMNTSGNIVTIPLSSINMTPAQAEQNIAGTMHSVGWGVNGAPSIPNINQLSLSYSHGCIFITNDSNTEGSIKLYCIDVSDWTVTEVTVPEEKPLPEGYYYIRSSLIDFPDGRIGKVSKYIKLSGDFNYQSTLRTYTVSGTGKNVVIVFSQDYLMSDTDTVYNDGAGWARDEHGIATDGTYLYRIQWNSVVPNTKVWTLSGDSSATVVYGGSYTQPYGNMHYISHNHIDNYYLVGYYDGPKFFITTAADPGPGPGNPLVPQFDTPTPTMGGFTVQITNYDDSFDWSGVSTNGGIVFISNTGLITVTGLTPGGSSIVTVNTEKSGFPDGTADVNGSSIPDDGDGISVEIEDGSPNNGDGNGDGTLDSAQTNVTSLKNTEISQTSYITLKVESPTCSALENVSVSTPPSDNGYVYPVGFLNFDAICNSGSTITVTVYYDNLYDTSNWVARKYTNGIYATINGASFGTAVVGGNTITTLTYDLTDGGSLDADGIVNGVIEDPVGPAYQQTPTVSYSSGYLRDGCKDPNATNYEYASVHNQNLCHYNIVQIPVQNPVITETICVPYIKTHIKYGANNNIEDVKKLEIFLNDKQGENLTVDGIYSIEDVAAVKRFQQKYASEVLNVWGLSLPTGYVYRTTLMKINSFYCNQDITCPAFTEYNSLSENSSSLEVQKTKMLLTDLGFYSGPVDALFDMTLKNSLKMFQETFSATMLKPWGLHSGTGYKYKTTNKFLNLIMGCKTDAVDLDGQGTFNY